VRARNDVGLLRVRLLAIKNAKPGTKPDKLSDDSGLFLLLTPEGGRRWRHL
jgi:hypothetical protein